MWKETIMELAKESGFENQDQLAKYMGWSRQQLNIKLVNPLSWSPLQVLALAESLGLKEQETEQLVRLQYQIASLLVARQSSRSIPSKPHSSIPTQRKK